MAVASDYEELALEQESKAARRCAWLSCSDVTKWRTPGLWSLPWF